MNSNSNCHFVSVRRNKHNVPTKEENQITLVLCLQALMVQKNGTLYLKDIQRGTKVCQLTLPETHQLASPWDPIVAFGGQGQLLFVKGQLDTISFGPRSF